MKDNTIDGILRNLGQVKKCYIASEDQEVSTVISIAQLDHDAYSYTRSSSHRYDVVSPVHYDHRTLNENELRALLSRLSDVENTISYVEKPIVHENNREKVDAIYSYLRQSPRLIYVVLKEDQRKKSVDGNTRNFQGLFRTRELAEQMMDYLRSKQGAECSLKEITLTLKDGEIELVGELSQFDQVNRAQILVSLLDMDINKIAKFFEGSNIDVTSSH